MGNRYVKRVKKPTFAVEQASAVAGGVKDLSISDPLYLFVDYIIFLSSFPEFRLICKRGGRKTNLLLQQRSRRHEEMVQWTKEGGGE